jgi:DNA-binding GntR family transcriptional regulator
MQALYARVAADLRRRIASGEWPPGTPLPSHRRLREMYGVSDNTIEAALRVLHQAGEIETHHKARAQVVDPPAVRTLVDPEADWLYGHGDTEPAQVQASGDIAARLDVPPGTTLARECTELLDPGGRPSHLRVEWRPPETGGAVVGRRCEALVRGAEPKEALLLGVAQGSALMVVEVTRIGVDGRPVSAADLLLPADRWRVRGPL